MRSSKGARKARQTINTRLTGTSYTRTPDVQGAKIVQFRMHSNNGVRSEYANRVAITLP